MAESLYTDIFRLLTKDGWEFKQAGGPSPWTKLKTAVPGRHQLEVYFSGDTRFCRFETLVAGIQPTRSCLRAIASFLLEVNHHLWLARFSIDGTGQVHLIADLPASSASPAMFRMLLDAIKTYFQQYHEEIELLATQNMLARLREDLVDEVLPEEIGIGVAKEEAH